MSMVPRAVTKLLEEFPEARVSIIDGPYTEQLPALPHGRLDVIADALRAPTQVQQRFLDRLEEEC